MSCVDSAGLRSVTTAAMRVNRSLVPFSTEGSISADSFLPHIGVPITHCLKVQNHETSCRGIDISAKCGKDNSWMVSGAMDGKVHLHSISRPNGVGNPSQVLEGLPGYDGGPVVGITDVAWRSSFANDIGDGRNILLAGTEGINCRLYQLNETSTEPLSLCAVTSLGVATVRDAYRNPGHTSSISQVGWVKNAFESTKRFYSSSMDGTLRLYDISDASSFIVSRAVIKHGESNPLAARVPITAVSSQLYGGATHFATGGQDGAVQLWDSERLHSRKHTSRTEVSQEGICGLSLLEHYMAVRTYCGAVVIYDLRKIKENAHLSRFEGLETLTEGPCDIMLCGRAASSVCAEPLVLTSAWESGSLTSHLVVCSPTSKQCLLELGRSPLRRIWCRPGMMQGVMAISDDSGAVQILHDQRGTYPPGGMWEYFRIRNK